MKNLIILLVLLTAAIGQAQEVTALEEVNIAFSPLDAKVIQNGNHFIYNYAIKKINRAEFASDPIGFLNKNFNIHYLIALLNEKKYDSFEVTLKSSNGFMVAIYDGVGNLIKTHQNFKNKVLPYHLRLEVYNSNIGWTMIKNNYVAKTKGKIMDKASYKITLQNGNEKRKIKIDATAKKYDAVASN